MIDVLLWVLALFLGLSLILIVSVAAFVSFFLTVVVLSNLRGEE